VNVEVREEPIAALAEHARVPIAFTVESLLEVSTVEVGLGGLALRERALRPARVKDYDALDGPLRWPRRFDVSRWGLLGAHDGVRRVGGAVIAFDTPALDLLEGRRDLAFLWDIRVAPEQRGRGVGRALLAAVEAWAGVRACRRLGVETQNVNVPACRFYARAGFELGAVRRYAYPELPDEVQLLWYKALLR
jgi:GNAT superfamily N-acetyltransferase